MEVFQMEEIIKKLDKSLRVIGYRYEGDDLIIDVESTANTGICPSCFKHSSRIHSRYIRQIKDLPIQEYKVILNQKTKIFFCKNKECKVKKFSEQFDFIETHSRMTKRLESQIIETSKPMSARASKEVINNGLVKVSDDTILRLLKKTIIKINKNEITKVCIDDFAIKNVINMEV